VYTVEIGTDISAVLLLNFALHVLGICLGCMNTFSTTHKLLKMLLSRSLQTVSVLVLGIGFCYQNISKFLYQHNPLY